MTETNTVEVRPPSPEVIAMAVRMFREHLGWKQINLAHEAGVDERTIQRVERGEKASAQTLRQIAKALKFEDPDVFTTPQRVPTKEEWKAELKKRVTIPVSVAETGGQVVTFILACGYFHFDHPEPLDEEDASLFGELFDSIMDYEMALSDLPPSARSEAGRYFDDLLARLGERGFRLYLGERRVKLHFKCRKDVEPWDAALGYTFLATKDAPVKTMAIVDREVKFS